MVELVSVMVFKTHEFRKKLTKRQTFKKPNDFRQANETLAEKLFLHSQFYHSGLLC